VLTSVAIVSTSLSAQAESAEPADSFVDSIGTNVHFLYSNYIDHFDSVVVPGLSELGIRHIRDGILLDDEPFNQRLRAVGAHGVKGTFITRYAQFPALIDWAKGMAPYIDTLEGPNEPHNEPASYKGQSTLGSIKPYQQDLYAAVRAEPLLSAVKVATPGIDWFPAYSSVGDLDQWADYGNFHHWPPSTGEVPYKGTAPTDGLFKGRDGKESSGLLAMVRTIASTKPLIATETGWSTTQESPTAGGGWDPGVSEGAAARFATRVMLELFKQGVRHTFLYELLDEPETPDPVKKHQGMLSIDGALKPHARALKNLIALLTDPGADFAAGSLDFSLQSSDISLLDDHDYKTQDVHHLLLQKRSGVFFLVIWNEALSYDNQAEQDIPIADREVLLTLSTPIERARVFRPLESPDALESFAHPSQLTLAVPDHPLIVELSPPGSLNPPSGNGGDGGANGGQTGGNGSSSGGMSAGNGGTALGSGGTASTPTSIASSSQSESGGNGDRTLASAGAKASAAAEDDPSGCGCRATRSVTSRGGWWALGLVALFWLRRLRSGD
jgi:MYXO-CTERM domain-containing protein